ncbi:MAG: hypothetical protein JNM56_17475 [Planctomycetia bacterium]|nr:hypothetical protein [Planctomycetia bacterium]
MSRWRNLAILCVVLAATRPALAQDYTLTETLQPGDCCQLKLSMKLTGEWRVQREDKIVGVPLQASATHEFPERILRLDDAGVPIKVARHYHQAQVVIKAGESSPNTRTVRDNRRLIVAQRCKEQFYTYSPDGSLGRDELETLEHFDTLALLGVLPAKAVKVGETWKLPSAIAQGLCSFEALVDHELTVKLEAVQGDQVRLSITGAANGINLGANVKLTVEASCVYDLKQQRLTAVTWKQKDVRDQGPASPATTMEATWTVQRTFLTEMPKEVHEFKLAKVPEGSEAPPAAFLQLHYRDPQGRFQLNYERDWHLAGQTDDHLILRLMDRGDWVAQATITAWTKAEAGKHLSADEFKETIADTPGWEPEQIRDDGEVRSAKGHWVYRVSALGDLDGLRVLQNFYLAAGPEGDQAAVTVTLREAQAQKLGNSDTKLVDGLDFPKP